MLASEPPAATWSQEKPRPPAKLPSADVLRRFPPAEVSLLKRLLSEHAEYVPNEFFDQPDAEQSLMGSLYDSKDPPAGQPTGSDDGGAGPPQPSRATAQMDRERYLFLRLNYCRRRVLQVLHRFQGKRFNAEAVRELLKWKHAEQETRSEIVRANVALVLAMARRTRITGVDLTDLISEGNLALLRSVDKFDCARLQVQHLRLSCDSQELLTHRDPSLAVPLPVSDRIRSGPRKERLHRPTPGRAGSRLRR